MQPLPKVCGWMPVCLFEAFTPEPKKTKLAVEISMLSLFVDSLKSRLSTYAKNYMYRNVGLVMVKMKSHEERM